MPHPDIDNLTAFSVAPLLVQDESGAPLLAVIAKATLAYDKHGCLTRAEAEPVDFTGQLTGPDDAPWYVREPETAFVKPATDVVLLGHARPPESGLTYFDIGVRCGPLSKRARVFGDRYWVRQGTTVGATRPLPVGSVALTWDNAFGGWDRSDADETKHGFEPRNPAGTGFGQTVRADGERVRLPSIEDPQDLIAAYGQVVNPTGFGFVAPSWQPRAALAGTYDAEWEAARKPLLPRDFDRRFFNAAAPGLIANGYLQGNERIDLVHVGRVPRLSVALPGFPPPTLEFSLRGGKHQRIDTHLDTVIIDADAMRISLLWRGGFAVRDPATNVLGVAVDCAHPAAKRPRDVA